MDGGYKDIQGHMFKLNAFQAGFIREAGYD